MLVNYKSLAEGPGVARGKMKFKKMLKKNSQIFLAYNTTPMSVHKKLSPIGPAF